MDCRSVSLHCFYRDFISLLCNHCTFVFPSLSYRNTDDKTIQRIIQKEKYLHSKLSEDDKLNILNDLKSFLRSESNPFLNPALTLVEVAKIIKVTPQQLSQVVNEKTNLNFTNYINTYRIEKAKEILTSHDFSKHTIDSIAEMAGFQSKSPFYLAFKKHTGMTPKEYISTAGDKLVKAE